MSNRSEASLSRDRCRSLDVMILAAMVSSGIMVPLVAADFDVNSVAGTAMLDGAPAPAGTLVRVMDLANGHMVTTSVDGPNVPPFMRGQGRYETGDVSYFNTGETVEVSFADPEVYGTSVGVLRSGTTNIDLQGARNQAPLIDTIPQQRGVEDVSWTLDLSPYIWDPNDPKSSLVLSVKSPYVSAQGFLLTFLYPEGVLSDQVRVEVSDGRASAVATIYVTVSPVNDPPRILEMPKVSLIEGGEATLRLDDHVKDPDNNPAQLVWTFSGNHKVGIRIDATRVAHFSCVGWYGEENFTLRVQDPGGLYDQRQILLVVEQNLSEVIEVLRAQIEQMGEEKEMLEEALNRSGGEIGLLNQTLDEARRRYSELTGQLSLLASQKESLEAEKRRLEANILDEQAAREALEKEVRSLLERNSTLTLNLAAKVQELAKLARDVEDLGSALKELEASKASAESSYSSVVSGLYERIQDLQSMLQEKDRELQGTFDELSILQSDAQSLEDKLTATESEKENQTSRLSDMVDVLLSEKEWLAEEVKRLLAEQGELNATISRMRESTPPPQGMGPGAEGSNELAALTQANGSVESGIAYLARLVQRGGQAVSRVLGSRMAVLVVAMLVGSSAVSIAARTSWIQRNRPGGPRKPAHAPRPGRGWIQTREAGASSQAKQTGPGLDVDALPLSDVDRQYVKYLVKLGFTKEAEKEARKRFRGRGHG